eukprot:TRINITY_DN617_c6_g1_i1.p1 TRINITY_DN617_c6_g1~~TRINITY_DN617_c6_g1_i1.p1  ORF type:complete len:323 (+),score=100.03 TRINITY_DN617_c6_g1_i1:51-971(+)
MEAWFGRLFFSECSSDCSPGQPDNSVTIEAGKPIYATNFLAKNLAELDGGDDKYTLTAEVAGQSFVSNFTLGEKSRDFNVAVVELCGDLSTYKISPQKAQFNKAFPEGFASLPVGSHVVSVTFNNASGKGPFGVGKFTLNVTAGGKDIYTALSQAITADPTKKPERSTGGGGGGGGGTSGSGCVYPILQGASAGYKYQNGQIKKALSASATWKYTGKQIVQTVNGSRAIKVNSGSLENASTLFDYKINFSASNVHPSSRSSGDGYRRDGSSWVRASTGCPFKTEFKVEGDVPLPVQAFLITYFQLF